MRYQLANMSAMYVGTALFHTVVPFSNNRMETNLTCRIKIAQDTVRGQLLFNTPFYKLVKSEGYDVENFADHHQL